MMRRRSITSITDAERSSEDPVHAGVRRQDDAAGLEPLTKLGLQVPGDRDHDRRGLETAQVIDQLELLFWSQGGLQDDDVATLPCIRAGLPRAARLDRGLQPAGGAAAAPRDPQG